MKICKSFLLAIALCGPLYAQKAPAPATPAAPAASAANELHDEKVKALQAKMDKLQLQAEILVQKLSGLTEFQQLQQVQQQFAMARQEMGALVAANKTEQATPAEPAKKP